LNKKQYKEALNFVLSPSKKKRLKERKKKQFYILKKFAAPLKFLKTLLRRARTNYEK